MNVCPECDRLAKVVMYGVKAPTWACPECGKEIEDNDIAKG